MTMGVAHNFHSCPLGHTSTPQALHAHQRWVLHAFSTSRRRHFTRTNGALNGNLKCKYIEKGSVEEVGSSTEPLGLGYANFNGAFGVVFLVCKVGLGTIGVGEESLTQIAQSVGLAVAVGICGVLQGTGNYGFSGQDLHRQHGAKLCGK